MQAAERVLVRRDDGCERREVRLIEGVTLDVVEETSGPVTEMAYGSWRHGHKVLVAGEACRAALNKPEGQAGEAVAWFFERNEGDVLLSEFMDVLDEAGQGYVYATWDGDGDLRLRGKVAPVGT